MALTVNIKTNSKLIQKRFKRLEKRFPRAIDKGIMQAGFQLLDIIRTKTKRGVDFQDVPFEPYSAGYLKKLQREGKPTKVDLFYSGRMLGALTPSKRTLKPTGKHKISVSFSNSQMMQRAVFNQVLKEPNRVFFDFSKSTERVIQKSFEKFIDKHWKL
mgnify:CR=1 FL=1